MFLHDFAIHYCSKCILPIERSHHEYDVFGYPWPVLHCSNFLPIRIGHPYLVDFNVIFQTYLQIQTGELERREFRVLIRLKTGGISPIIRLNTGGIVPITNFIVVS